MIKQRDFPIYVLLSIITCGIYGLYWTYLFINDINKLCEGDGEETPSFLMYFLLSLVTCGIYSIYWHYKVADRIYKNGFRFNVQIQETGSTVLLWIVVGSLLAGIGYFIGMYLIIKNFNLLADEYNKNAS
ncbi:MAG: DUF4234 domain-containing protein [Clostridiales bacterium]|jgi:hypothetical protein|nr:DUF4234 domain-containing protein [Clostridiales bacterium]